MSSSSSLKVMLSWVAVLWILSGCLAEENTTEVTGLDGDVSGRVVNGLNALLGQYPYQGLAHMPNKDGSSYEYCGVSLISLNHVLTAAHCTNGKTTVQIYLGIIDSSQRQNGFVTYAIRIWIHSNFNSGTLANDISIIRMARSAPISNNIQIIRLTNNIYPSSYDNGIAVVSGWGRTFNTQNYQTRYLQYQRLRIMKHSSCQFELRGNGITNGQICTDKSLNRPAGPCQGDSGGPLAYFVNNVPTLIGITSYRVGECLNYKPEVYTYVGWYLNDIRSQLRF